MKALFLLNIKRVLPGSVIILLIILPLKAYSLLLTDEELLKTSPRPNQFSGTESVSTRAEDRVSTPATSLDLRISPSNQHGLSPMEREPGHSRDKAQPLPEQSHSSDENSAPAAKEQLGEAQITQYKEIILQAPPLFTSSSSLNSPTGIVTVRDARLLNTLYRLGYQNTLPSLSLVKLARPLESINFQNMSPFVRERTMENIESWSNVLYYSKKIGEALSEGESRFRVRPLVSRDAHETEDNPFIIIDVVKYFEQWGIPSPFTIVFFVIGIYLVLSFLSRGK